MNYYLLNTNQWDLLDKNLVEYKHPSLDGTQLLVITAQISQKYLFKFASISKFVLHSYYTTDEWMGDGGQIELTEIHNDIYIQEIDEI
tara:strand:- start:3099 stop:3362 length:264 start_codon:yes stop_codon:yes gene_type:complete